LVESPGIVYSGLRARKMPEPRVCRLFSASRQAKVLRGEPVTQAADGTEKGTAITRGALSRNPVPPNAGETSI
jgi:hypothetical protein